MTDDPLPHEPKYLTGFDWKKNLEKAVSYIRDDGLKIPRAISLAFGCSENLWYKWRDWAIEDRKNGYTGTNLLHAVTELCKADIDGERKFSRKARDLALDETNPSVELLKFILERRYDYKKQTQQEVEVSSNDDWNFNINIVDTEKKD